MTTTTPVATPPVTRPERPSGPRIVRWVAFVLVSVPLVWAVIGLEITPARLAEAPAEIWHIFRQMVPPAWENTGRTFDKLLESLYIAWVGTIIGAVLSLPLAFMAAANMAPRWIATPTRAFLSAVRSFPELLLAFVLLPITGLGAFTGTLAIGLHSIGTLGKLASEVVEGIDEGPVEAIQAAGGTRPAQVRYGVLPQVMPTVMAYWLYRFEINIRASAVLGVIGAGGVGAELVGRLRFRDFPEAGTVLVLTVATVLVIDAISGSIRRRIISGEPGSGPLARGLRAVTGRRAADPA